MTGKRNFVNGTWADQRVALIENRGQITIGRLAPFECVAIANDQDNTAALLVRRANESLPDLISRPDMAIEAAYGYDQFVAEMNDFR